MDSSIQQFKSPSQKSRETIDALGLGPENIATGGPRGAGLLSGIIRALKGAKKTRPPHPGVLGKFKTTTPGRILSKTKSPKGGYTVNPITGKVPVTGLLAGLFRNTDPRNTVVPVKDLTRKQIVEFAKKNEKALRVEGRYIGTWRDPKDGMVYLDVVKRFPPGADRKIAVFGGRTQQKAYFDVGADKARPIGNWSEFIKGTEMKGRMREMEKVGGVYLEKFPTKEWWDMHGGPFERVYGKSKLRQLAGMIASTAPGTDPRTNLQTMSEYMRRVIKGEDIVQPGWRVPAGQMTRKEGTQIGLEKSRIDNLGKSVKGRPDLLQLDKVRNEAMALMGDKNVAVFDRWWARLSEAPERGIYADASEGKLGEKAYLLLKKVMRKYTDDANALLPKSQHVSMRDRSANIWTGVRETVKARDELYGTKFQGSAIPGDSKSYADQFEDLIREKANHLGITVKEMEKRLRKGSATLMSLVLATKVGWEAFTAWRTDETAEPAIRTFETGGLGGGGGA